MRILVSGFVRLRVRGGMASAGWYRQGVCQLRATVELLTINEFLTVSEKLKAG